MSSLIVISLYIIICLIVLGLTQSISDTHYRWVEKYGFYGYVIFPAVMMVFATLVILENNELAWAGIGIYYVAVFAMFKEKQRHIGVIHYLGAVLAIGVMMYHIFLWHWWVVLIWVILCAISLKSKYKIYIIEILAIIILYVYKFNY